MDNANYRRGLSAVLGCFAIWGFQPLYWYLCDGIDTFFLMASRIVWGGVCCVGMLWVQGKLPQLLAVFRDRKVLLREIPASVFLLADWGIYLWAVQNGKVLDCSLGYYIQPLVVSVFGAVIYHEKVTWRHFVILALIVTGIALSTTGFGRIPYVTIALAVCFAVYAAIKKSLTVDSVVSTTAEALILTGPAIVYILLFCTGANGLSALTPLRQVLLIGAGIVTALPIVLYSVGVKHLTLMTTGICQYLSPTFSIICGLIMGESLTKEKLLSFCFIWAGVILYVVNMVLEEKRRAQAKADT